MTKTAMITICGRPNVGKSTLTNALVGEKVAIVSAKPQTTRNRITALVERGETQFVLLDTPGFHRPRTKLGDYMVNVVKESVADVDGVLLLVEPVAAVGPQEEALLERLREGGAPVILVINKIDTVERARLLEVIAAYAPRYDFEAVIPVSAKTGEGLDELFAEMYKFAADGPHFFPDDMITDQPERILCAEIIREKALRHLRDEVPHGIGVEIMKIESLSDQLTEINATVYCERDAHKGIIIGKHGAMLQTIGTEARADIEKLLGVHVNLKLWVKIRPDWRNNMSDLRNLGYDS